MPKINAKNFQRYGRLIIAGQKKSDKNKSLFHVVLTEPRSCGWRIAYLVLRDKSAEYMERHLDSFESFEPISGKALIYVAENKDIKRIRCFYLDQPVILKKGIWHNLVTLSRQSQIKITENANVGCDYWRLGFKLGKDKRLVRDGKRTDRHR